MSFRRRHNPLWIYAVIEIVIGCIGIALMLGMGWIANVYAQTAAQGLAGILQRGLYCAALLILPTMLMGAALPCLARLVRSTPDGMARLGRLYASNIIGAIAGCVLAGFYLLRLYDMPTATYFAAAVNAAVAMFSAILALATQYTPADREQAEGGAESRKQAGSRSLAGLPDDRAVRADRARRRGDLDPAAVFDVRPVGLHILHYSGGIFAGSRPRQRRGRAAGALHQGRRRRARRLSVSAGCRRRLVGVHDRRGDAVLADRSRAGAKPMGQLPDRRVALCVGRFAGRYFMGREFSFRACGSFVGSKRMRVGSSARSTRPTPSARSSARSASAWS